MNELQKKLMRRRSLNGELNGSTGEAVPVEASEPPVVSPSIEKKKELPKPPIASAKGGSSAASELQSKLARRRGLNGEPTPGGGANTAPPDSKDQISTAAPAHAVAPEEIPEQVIERSASGEVHSSVLNQTPAWLDKAHAEKVQQGAFIAEPVTSAPKDTPSHPIPPSAVMDEHTGTDAAPATVEHADAPRTVTAVRDDPPCESAAVEEEEVVHTAPAPDNEGHAATEAPTAEVSTASISTPPLTSTDLPVLAVEQPEPEQVCQKESLSHANPATTEVPALAPGTGVDVVTEEQAPVPSQPTDLSVAAAADANSEVSACTDSEAASALPTVPEQKEVARRHSVKLSTALPVLSDPFPLPGADGTGEAATPGPVYVPVAVLPTIPVSAAQAQPVYQDVAVPSADTPMAAADVAELSLAVTAAASNAADDTSGVKEATAVTTAAVDIRTASEPAPVLPKNEQSVPARSASTSPMRLSTGAKTQPASAAPGGSSPLHRVNTTGSGASAKSSTSTVSPLRRTSSLSGSQTVPAKKTSWYPGKFILEGPSAWSGKAKPMMKMNPDAARNHYAALMSSSAQDFTDEQLAASASQRANSTGDALSGGLSPKMTTSQQREEELRAAQLPDMVAAGSSDDTIDMVIRLSRENGQLKREVAHLRAELERQQALVESLRRGEGGAVYAIPSSESATGAQDSASVGSTTAAQGVKFVENGATGPAEHAAPVLSKTRSSRRFAGRGYYSNYQDGGEEDEEDLFGDDGSEKVAEKSPNYRFAEFAMDDDLNAEGGEANGAFGSARKSRMNSFGSGTTGDADAADQNLDLLLKSVTGSGVKEKDRRSLDAQKYLVQSFMSTSTITPQETKQERNARSEQGQGDWQERFGSLGLISSDAEAKPEDQLFTEPRTGKTNANTSAEEAAADSMDYTEFLGKFLRTVELTNLTRDFILSVLGPNGDATAPTTRKKLGYVFYGDYKLDLRCKQWFDDISDRFLTWPEFRSESDERLICARDGIEQYVMQRIGEYAFRSTLDTEGDEALLRRMKLLAFVRPEMLDIKPDMYNETLLAIAADELRKINSCRSTGDKVACVVKCSAVIFRSLSLSKAAAEASNPADRDNTNIAGADDFTPLLIWVVLRSHIPKLSSNVAYIQAFLNPARLMGKWGYCLISLCSAIEFVRCAEADQFLIDPKEFETKLLQAEKALNGGF